MTDARSPAVLLTIPAVLMAESPDLHPLFVQLQTRYPTSGLLTELVQIYADHFVVRALVQFGNVTLATSLAAAATVEQAEDQARLRVLALMGIRPSTLTDLPAPSTLPTLPFSSYGTQPQSTTKQPLTEAFQDTALPPIAFDRVEQEPVAFQLETGAAIAPLSPVPPLALSFEPPTLTEATLPAAGYPTEIRLKPIDAPDQDDEASEPEFLEPEPFESELFEPQSFEFEPEPFEPQSFEPELQPTGQEAESPSAEPADTITDQQGSKSKPRKPSTGKEVSVLETLSSASRDLSSLISQIGVEIDRIGWSKRQGSTYLQKTYGKKTRSELTDDELEDFLTYLNTQPSANTPPGE